MSRGQSGGVLLYAVLALLVLGSISFGFQRLLAPTATSGLDTLELARANAAEDAVKSILRQQLGKNGDGKKLYALLQTLHGKTLTLGDGSRVKLTFTPYWFRSKGTSDPVLPAWTKSVPFPQPGAEGVRDLIAIAGSTVKRFAYDFDAGKAYEPDTTTPTDIPANADVYFLLRRENTGLSQDIDTVAYGSATLSTQPEAGFTKEAVDSFTQSLPPRNGLVGLFGEAAALTSGGAASAMRDRHDASFVYGGWMWMENEDVLSFNKVGAPYVRNQLDNLSGGSGEDQYELVLGQHVLVNMAITLPSGAAFTRVWRFNGGKSLAPSGVDDNGMGGAEDFNLSTGLLAAIKKANSTQFTVDSTAPEVQGNRLEKVLAYFDEHNIDPVRSNIQTWASVPTGVKGAVYLYWTEADITDTATYSIGDVILVMRYNSNLTTYSVGWLPILEKTEKFQGKAYTYRYIGAECWNSEGVGEDKNIKWQQTDTIQGYGMSSDQKKEFTEAKRYYDAVKAKYGLVR